jgi:hypothetical protein
MAVQIRWLYGQQVDPHWRGALAISRFDCAGFRQASCTPKGGHLLILPIAALLCTTIDLTCFARCGLDPYFARVFMTRFGLHAFALYYLYRLAVTDGQTIEICQAGRQIA